MEEIVGFSSRRNREGKLLREPPSASAAYKKRESPISGFFRFFCIYLWGNIPLFCGFTGRGFSISRRETTGRFPNGLSQKQSNGRGRGRGRTKNRNKDSNR